VGGQERDKWSKKRERRATLWLQSVMMRSWNVRWTKMRGVTVTRRLSLSTSCRSTSHFSITSWTSQKNPPPPRFLGIFRKLLGIFSPNFTHLIYVSICDRLQIFIQLSLILIRYTSFCYFLHPIPASSLQVCLKRQFFTLIFAVLLSGLLNIFGCIITLLYNQTYEGRSKSFEPDCLPLNFWVKKCYCT